MPIPFTCPHCSHQTLVEDKYAGESGKCIECGKPISVPLANTQGAVIPQEKVDLTGGSAAGVAISCGVVMLLVVFVLFSGMGFLWFWWGMGFGW